MDKLFILHILDKGLLSGLCKELLQNSYEKTTQLRWEKDFDRFQRLTTGQ